MNRPEIRSHAAAFVVVLVVSCSGFSQSVSNSTPRNGDAVAPDVFGPSDLPSVCHSPASVFNLGDALVDGLRADAGVDESLQIDGPPNGTVVLDATAADTIMCELRQAHLVEGRGHYAPMRYDQIYNDCQYRAELAIDYLTNAHPGMVLGKVFISGRLGVYAGSVGWGFHVAPYTVVTNEDKTQSIVVLDPALDATHAIPLKDWVREVRGTGSVRVFLANPGVYGISLDQSREHFNRDTKTYPPPLDEKTFCDNVKDASTRLAAFEHQKLNLIRPWRSVTVASISDDGVVYISENGQKQGPFGARRELAKKLREAGTKAVKICSQPEYGSTWLKNIWTKLGGKEFDVIYAVDDPDNKPCPQPRYPACSSLTSK
jgi:hypothetical protein